MKIPDKLPNPPKYRDFPELTKEEWEDYYACREKCDIDMTEDEILEIYKKAGSLIDKGLKTEALALLIKIAGGFKSIQYLNLSKAKKSISRRVLSEPATTYTNHLVQRSALCVSTTWRFTS